MDRKSSALVFLERRTKPCCYLSLRGLLIGLGLSCLTACLSLQKKDRTGEASRSVKTKTEVIDSAPASPFDWRQVREVIPKPEPKSRYGNPSSYEQDGIHYHVMASADNYKKQGVASWYGTKFHGRRTSSGEIYDMFSMTAAHKTLPIPCYAKVTNLDNGRQVTVKINDRGPFKKHRIIDLSYAAAHKLGMSKVGTANVKVETITFSKAERAAYLEQYQRNLHNREQNNRFVQVGAYANYEKAQKLAKNLNREIQFPVKITTTKKKGKRLYRVRVGPVPSQRLAENLVSTLDIEELGKPKIVYQ